MKKTFYLIPLILLALSMTHISLHNDTVNHDPNGDLRSLKPSHWRVKDYNLNVSFSLQQAVYASSASNINQNIPLSQGATFNGFPFGFYFKNTQTTSTSSLQVSAYSWLWASIDAFLIILTLLIAVLFNRSRKDIGPSEAIHSSTANPTYFPPTPPDSPPSQNT